LTDHGVRTSQVEAELVADTLEIALAARTLDVRASPYDATEFGLDPVRVETPRGRAQYKREQLALMQRAAPVRARLLEAYDLFLEAGGCSSPTSCRSGAAPTTGPERGARGC
jgi:hypothetical protein